MPAFYLGLGVICASSLMYEIILTRLLSVICWYYLAFVSVSMAMFGMAAGGLVVQLYPAFFASAGAPKRMAQGAFAMAASLPVALMVMFAIPLGVAMAVQTVASFLIFCSVIAVPFFFAGSVVCLSLTQTSFPVGRIYSADLLGAGMGCFGSLLLMNLIDAPSAVMAVSALAFLGAAAYAAFAYQPRLAKRALLGAAAMALIAGLNASTLHGIQPIWSKGILDARRAIVYETWNPISRIRVNPPQVESEFMGVNHPPVSQEVMDIDIDNGADTGLFRFGGDWKHFDFLRYRVSSLGARLRAGGSAAIIGLGGGRDAIACAVYNFHRIVGIEINPGIVDVTSRRFDAYGGLSQIPHLELHRDEGRSYFTRSREKFDMIQATLVDTWAATAAGATALTENSLYSLEGWRIFYEHLAPGGIISFTRWYFPPDCHESTRLFSLAYATLLSEGVSDPQSHLAMVRKGDEATLLTGHDPLSPQDVAAIRDAVANLEGEILYLPGEINMEQLRPILRAHTTGELAALRSPEDFDLSPPTDASPYFFSFIRFRDLPAFLHRSGADHSVLLPQLDLAMFLLAAVILVSLTLIWPARRWTRSQPLAPPAPAGVMIYFLGIGMGFILAEMAMMQQLAIFLGQPIYSLAVVLAGLILAAGAGSFASEQLRLRSARWARTAALASAIVLLLYWQVVLPVIHHEVARVLALRIVLSFALVVPCGLVLGFCFPLGMRWASEQGQQRNLPWMWALNGAASVLASFIAVIISTEVSIGACVLAAAACYALAGTLIAAKGSSRRAPAPASAALAPHGT